MISILTPTGSKKLILRGIRTPSGNKAIEAASILAPGSADYQFWDGSLASLAVGASPMFVQGAAASPTFVTINTGATTASVTGGSPPYSYAWTVQNEGGGSWLITSPSSATTSFQAAAVDTLEQFTGTMRCTVTDSRGATGTVDVTAFVRNYGQL